MTTLREAAQQALQALENIIGSDSTDRMMAREASTSLRQALEAERNEPDEFYDWWTFRPSLTRLQAYLLWREELDAEMRQTIASEQQDEPVAWVKPNWKSDDWSTACTDKEKRRYGPNHSDTNMVKFCAAHTVPLYTRPQPKQQPLTDEQIELNWQFLHGEDGSPPDQHGFARAIEAAHNIKDES